MQKSNLPNSTLTPQTRRAMAFKSLGSHTLKAAHVSKLRDGNLPHHSKHSQSILTGSTAQSDMTKMSQEQQLRVIDNENALQLMPEIEWACRVLVSSILSPKDMTKRELNYAIDLDWMNPTVKAVILEEIKKDMEAVYDYSNSLYYIFKDALFSKGSHPRLILPEAAVDMIINSGHTLTMEALGTMFEQGGITLKSKGYFGPKNNKVREAITMESYRKANEGTTVTNADEAFTFECFSSLENFTDKKNDHATTIGSFDCLTLTDNFEALKLAPYLEVISESRRQDLASRPKINFDDFDFGISEEVEMTNETFIDPKALSRNSKLSADEFKEVVYKSAPNNIVTHLRIPGRDNLVRRSVGRPLMMSIPSESVIPIHIPGNVRRKIGAIVILGENGHPITLEGADQTIARAQNMFNAMNTSNSVGKDAMGSMILSKAARNLTGGLQVTNFRDLSKIFEQLFEENIVPRLMNGAYPSGVELADSSDLYTLMMSRIFCSMRTRMVFVPAEMMTYFAFDYHSNGMGKSLLDANKMLIAFRAGMLLTRATGEMRNSIPLTKVTMKIDEDDADWEKTYEEALHIISQTRQPSYPLSTLAVNDLMDWVHRAGFVFSFQGHPRIPDTGFDWEKISFDNKLPDQDFYDSLGRQLYMGFGIPPELMDSTYDPEFAIAIASRNIMFTQTILESQKIASGLITDDHHRLILSDGVLMNKIVGMVKSKWGEITSNLPAEDMVALKTDPKRFAMDLVKRIVTAIVVTLPQPDATTLENQHERFRQFKDFLEEAFPFFASAEVVSSDIAPELSQKIDTMAPMIKAGMLREFMSDNNMLPQLFAMGAVDEEGKPQFDVLKMTESWTSGLMANAMSAAKALVPIDQAAAEDSETLKLGSEGGSGMSGGGGFSSGGGGGGDFGMSDFGGGGGGDNDISMNDMLPLDSEAGGEKADGNPPEEGGTPAV